MKHKICLYRLVAIFIVYPLLLTACGNSNNSQSSFAASTEKLINGCIPPITSFAYPANQQIPDSLIAKQQIPPSTPWKIEASMPNLPPGAQDSFDDISVAHPRAGYSEIWVKRRFDIGGTEFGGGTASLQTLIFQTDTENWRTFSQQIQDSPIRIDELYQGKNGSLFADISFSNKSALGLYNEKEGQFDLVKNSNSIPDSIHVLDNNGTLWILNNKDGIYSFDPSTSQLEKRVDIPDLVVQQLLDIYGRTVAFAPDGSLYFLNFQDSGNTELIRYDPVSNKLERNVEAEIEYWLGLLYYLDTPVHSLYVDHLGNVWLEDQGWITPDGAWYKVVRSPIFIAEEVPDIPLKYVWVHPSILLESSDNRLWFSSANGMAWLDPQKGEWCWFTTYQSNIVEDQQHNLWMIADNKLYKYSLINH